MNIWSVFDECWWVFIWSGIWWVLILILSELPPWFSCTVQIILYFWSNFQIFVQQDVLKSIFEPLEFDFWPLRVNVGPLEVDFWSVERRLGLWHSSFRPLGVDFRRFVVKWGTWGVIISTLGVEFRPLRVHFRPLRVDIWLKKLIFGPQYWLVYLRPHVLCRHYIVQFTKKIPSWKHCCIPFVSY